MSSHPGRPSVFYTFVVFQNIPEKPLFVHKQGEGMTCFSFLPEICISKIRESFSMYSRSPWRVIVTIRFAHGGQVRNLEALYILPFVVNSLITAIIFGRQTPSAKSPKQDMAIHRRARLTSTNRLTSLVTTHTRACRRPPEITMHRQPMSGCLDLSGYTTVMGLCLRYQGDGTLPLIPG